MKNKIFLYGIPFGLIPSLIGFLLIKTEIISQNLIVVFIKIYEIATIMAVVVIIIKSSFLKINLKLIFKILLLLIVVALIFNVLKEFKIIDFQFIGLVVYLLFGSLIGFYIFYFIKKEKKNMLDLIKVIFVTLIYVGGFLDVLNITLIINKFISNGLFWIIVISVLNQIRKNQYNETNKIGKIL